MLVLSRKVGEKIVIGNNITIVVQRVGKGRVALAIEAPQNVTVLRGELAPFGVDQEQVEFIEVEVEETEPGQDRASSDAPLARSASRPTNRLTMANNRLREEASLRTGFPPKTSSLKPANEPNSARLPHSLPAR